MNALGGFLDESVAEVDSGVISVDVPGEDVDGLPGVVDELAAFGEGRRSVVQKLHAIALGERCAGDLLQLLEEGRVVKRVGLLKGLVYRGALSGLFDVFFGALLEGLLGGAGLVLGFQDYVGAVGERLK